MAIFGVTPHTSFGDSHRGQEEKVTRRYLPIPPSRPYSRMPKFGVWRIIRSGLNLLNGGRWSILVLQARKPNWCFHDRLKREGRWEAYRESIREHIGNPQALIRLRRYWGYRGADEIWWYLFRWLEDLYEKGREVDYLDRLAYEEEGRRVVAKHVQEMALRQEEETLSWEQQMLWIHTNWPAIMVTEVEDNRERLVVNWEFLLQARSRGIFHMAEWASKNPDEFMQNCMRMFMKTRKPDEKKPDDPEEEEARSQAEQSVSNLEEYLQQYGSKK